MKGISAVLAVVLIVVITVAIIGLAYAWATGLFGITTEASEQQVGGLTDSAQKSIEIISAACGEGETVVFIIRNTGTLDIDYDELTAFIDEDLVVIGPKGIIIEPDHIQQFGTLEFRGIAGTKYELKVDAPARAATYTFIC